jgi:hypothetical protein
MRYWKRNALERELDKTIVFGIKNGNTAEHNLIKTAAWR